MSIGIVAYDHTPSSVLLRALYWRRRLLNRLERETPYLRQYVRPGSICVDVGAYDGLYTIEFARWGAREVHAFEPHPVAAERLIRAYLTRATVHAVALSDRDGNCDLLVPPGRYGRAESHLQASQQRDPSLTRYTVQTSRLDSYALADVSLLKVDVEGHELEVVRGARETIERCKPTLFIEVEQRHHSRNMAEVFAEIESLAYRGRFLDWVAGRLQWRSIAEFDPRIHQTRPADRSPTIKDYYINNFLFLPA